ncbi:MAG: hypothetical protein HS126_30605 [Anaerolineales bacterium]|nr:hypothetical protein [Anaerolineales bacterium]
MPIYEFIFQLAALEPPPPEMQQLFAALRHDQEQTNRFFGTIAGTVPIPKFFAPENLGRVIGAEVQGVAVWCLENAAQFSQVYPRFWMDPGKHDFFFSRLWAKG